MNNSNSMVAIREVYPLHPQRQRGMPLNDLSGVIAQVFHCLTRRTLGIILLLISALLVGCGGSEKVPTEIDRGIGVVQYFASPRFFRLSAYPSVVEKHSPSNLVSYLFSDLGVAEWPPGDESSPLEKEQAGSTRMPVIPANTRLLPLRPDANPGFQIVLKPDDSRKVIVVEGYTGPNRPPIKVVDVSVADLPPGTGGR